MRCPVCLPERGQDHKTRRRGGHRRQAQQSKAERGKKGAERGASRLGERTQEKEAGRRKVAKVVSWSPYHDVYGLHIFHPSIHQRTSHSPTNLSTSRSKSGWLYASGMFMLTPLAATRPTMPTPKGTLICCVCSATWKGGREEGGCILAAKDVGHLNRQCQMRGIASESP